MIKNSFIIGLVLVCLFVLFLAIETGCGITGKKMSDEDYIEIKMKFADRMVSEMLDPKNQNKNVKELTKLYFKVLDDVCKEHGYTKNDFLRKIKDLGKRWEDEIIKPR
jgi:predicted metal-binding transcription factor (methanogenesis marker protein 9)